MNNEKYLNTLNNLEISSNNILKDIKILNLFNDTIKNDNDLFLLCNEIGIQYGGAPNDTSKDTHFKALNEFINDDKKVNNEKIKKNITDIRDKLYDIFNIKNTVKIDITNKLNNIKNIIEQIKKLNNNNDDFVNQFLLKFHNVLTKFHEENKEGIDINTLTTVETSLKKILENNTKSNTNDKK